MSEVFLVGGAVRDSLMNRKPKDFDYVVVGSNHEEMIASGFTKVGANFPVYLHPVSKEEYALARTETKTGDTHTDFDCKTENVTLIEDLSRRDLTCNAIAMNDGESKLIDPFGGINDIKHKILRHVSDAFSQDSLRVIRLARFNAQFGHDWTIAPETIEKICEVYKSGELDHLTPNRLWKELLKVLECKTPSIFFELLREMKLFTAYDDGYPIHQNLKHHPEKYVGSHTNLVMDYAARTFNDPEITFAALTHDWGKFSSFITNGNFYEHGKMGVGVIEEFCEKYQVPKKFRELAVLVCDHHTKIHSVLGCDEDKRNMLRPKTIMKLFEDTDAIRNPLRFEKILKVCIADSRGRGADKEQQLEYESKPYPQADYLCECLRAVSKVCIYTLNYDDMQNLKGKEIGERIRKVRMDRITMIRRQWKLLK